MGFFGEMTAAKVHSSGRFTATNTESQRHFPVKNLFSFIVCDGPGNLVLGIDENTEEGPGKNLIYLKPGEYITDLPRECENVYDRCETPGQTANWRALGV